MADSTGRITIGFVISLVLLALAIEAAYQIVPAYISYLGFKSEIESRAAQAVQNSGTTEDKLKAGLQDKAAELGVPLESGNLSVQLGDHSAHIVATWSPEVRFLAGRMVRRIHFTVDVVR